MSLQNASELLAKYDELIDAFDDDPRHGEKAADYQIRIHEQLLEIDEVHRQMWTRFPGYAAYTAPQDLESRLVEWWNGELGRWELAEIIEHASFYTNLDGSVFSHQPLTLRRWNHEEIKSHIGAIRMPIPRKRPKLPPVSDLDVTQLPTAWL